MTSRIARARFGGFALALVVAAGSARAQQDPVAELLDGVEDIAAPGTPSPLAVWSRHVDVVLVGNAGRELRAPAVAAGRAGAGRFVALPHHGYFAGSAFAKGQTGRFLVNATRWVCGQKKSPKVAARGEELVALLKEAGCDAHALGARPLRDELKDVDVVCGLGTELAEDDLAPLDKFLRGGGGLVAGQCAWSWQQSTNAPTLDANPLNRFLAGFGVAWTGGYLGKIGATGFPSERTPPKLVHCDDALTYVIGHRDPAAIKNDRPMLQASATLMALVPVLPRDDAIVRPRLESWLDDHGAELVVTPEKPLPLLAGAQRCLLAFALHDSELRPPREVKALACARTFPGEVAPSAPRIDRTVAIDTSIPRWRSTGLYAAPGEVVTVTLPEGRGVESAGLSIQIGAHTDELFEQPEWKRAPKVVRRVPLDRAQVTVASPVGGPIYVVVPFDCTLGTIEVTIARALEAPRFVLDRDTDESWRQQLRHRSAPWAELESRKVVLTLPSSQSLTLDAPEELLRTWDRIADAAADLVALPRARRSPERLVADVQTATGTVRSGYPIVVLLESVSLMTDPGRPARRDWSLFHELGRNHQEEAWAIEGDVASYLVGLYVLETVFGESSRGGGEWLAPLEEARARVPAYLAAGAPFDEWKKDPFLALQMHVQLQQAFGWELFKKVFTEYRGLPRRDLPKTEEARRDLWLVSLSRACHRDLGPFFTAWGVPTSDAARHAVSDLAEWMPEGFPPP